MKAMLKITGQCPSGKNAVVVTRSGHRFPAQRFVLWRSGAMQEIEEQLSGGGFEDLKKVMPIDYPVNVTLIYRTCDNRRRDIPGIIDAVWHLLEKCGVVKDDRFLGGNKTETKFINFGLIKDDPGIDIILEGEPNDNAGDLQVQAKQPKVRRTRRPSGTPLVEPRPKRKKNVDDGNRSSDS